MNNNEEQKIIVSFQNVKKDVSQILEDLKFALEKINKLDKENKRLNSVLTKVKPTIIYSRKQAAKTKKYVASKTGKKLHQSNCLHARNIKQRVIFKNKTDALNKGYKLCSCLAY